MKKKPINGKFDFKRLSADIIGKRIKDDLTTREAAKLAKIDPGTLNRLEFGKSTSLDTLARVCNWLGNTVQHYFS